MNAPQTVEHRRLADSEARYADWKNWGPYLSERAWGTVREDYSADGSAWDYFPHDHARSRAYRWNEDGLGGFCNRFQNICMSVALWNEHDPILKERLFGLTGPEGNHGEDVKEYYYYLDATPTHSYMKMLYKYPQVEYPYARLIEENRQRNKEDGEVELIDVLHDAFEHNRYFDVFIEYAKANEDKILCRISVINRGSEPAPIHVLPHLWFRNTWAWGHNDERPELRAAAPDAVQVSHRHLGTRYWYAAGDGQSELLFTENNTNTQRVFNTANVSPYVKDGINNAVVNGETGCVNPERTGTKCAAHFKAIVAPGETFTVRLCFEDQPLEKPFDDFDTVFERRIKEADQFYAAIQKGSLSDDEKLVQRQAFAGLLWSKQFYHYGVDLWLEGDKDAPPVARKEGRNHDWKHLYNLDVLSMPDKWEYPWFAAWDLAFHCVPLAMVDPEWAKRQLILLLREWYMHPNGQIPAYEWAFGDVNPPVHAWAAWRVYKIARNATGHGDLDFLERVFHKLLLNFTWWVNRKDRQGNNVFEGGFLGLDNIGVFDRSSPLPTGGFIGQADGTAWMGMFCLNMLAMALELARTRPAYEDVATKFFEHFIYIANAIHNLGGDGVSLWNAEDGFFYDVLQFGDGNYAPLKTRSFVGLIPLFAVETIDADVIEKLPQFRRRMEWFIKYRPQLVAPIASLTKTGEGGRRLLSLVNEKQLRSVLGYMLDSKEFLSEYGLRSLSKFHEANPYVWHANGTTYRLDYEPAESRTGLFGGNSNWRGPIWFPVNYLMIESLQKYHHYYGDHLKVDFPSDKGEAMSLEGVAAELSRRLTGIFVRGEHGHRAVLGDDEYMQHNTQWRDYVPFYEYFHGDSGKGLGASHQTGWTALVAKLIQQSGGQDD